MRNFCVFFIILWTLRCSKNCLSKKKKSKEKFTRDCECSSPRVSKKFIYSHLWGSFQLHWVVQEPRELSHASFYGQHCPTFSPAWLQEASTLPKPLALEVGSSKDLAWLWKPHSQGTDLHESASLSSFPVALMQREKNIMYSAYYLAPSVGWDNHTSPISPFLRVVGRFG